MNENTKEGLVLFAHGARDARWAVPFEAVAAEVRLQRPGVPVRLAYLEFMTPTLAEAAADLVRHDVQRVVVLPMFLGGGGHVRKDLPALLDALRAEHQGVVFDLHGAIGEEPSVLSAMARVAALKLA
jgi:sirohydrochlorin cobaltochelatase